MSSVVKGSMEAPPIGVCCRACEKVQLVDLSAVQVMLKRSFIVCTTCGHKRCPKATNHKLACTDSNASEDGGVVAVRGSRKGVASRVHRLKNQWIGQLFSEPAPDVQRPRGERLPVIDINKLKQLLAAYTADRKSTVENSPELAAEAVNALPELLAIAEAAMAWRHSMVEVTPGCYVDADDGNVDQGLESRPARNALIAAVDATRKAGT